MTDLRTLNDLKDLDLPVEKANIYGFSEILKQEAIKWVKFRISRKENPRDREIIFWCDRFNITEEDLK